jgi:ribosomal protein S8
MLQQVLAIINSGLKEKKKYICVPYNNKALKVIKLLYKEGYIYNYCISYNNIDIEFALFEGTFIFNGIKFYKKNNSFIYLTNKQLIRFFYKKKYMLLFTIFGICTVEYAIKKKIGGIILGELI